MQRVEEEKRHDLQNFSDTQQVLFLETLFSADPSEGCVFRCGHRKWLWGALEQSLPSLAILGAPHGMEERPGSQAKVRGGKQRQRPRTAPGNVCISPPGGRTNKLFSCLLGSSACSPAQRKSEDKEPGRKLKSSGTGPDNPSTA